MHRFMIRRSFLGVTLLLAWAPAAGYAQTAAELLPQTTKGYLSIPEVNRLRTDWENTQLGKLANDPLMRPFVEDLKKQLETKFQEAGIRLGLRWQDMEGVYGGEVALAAIQPGGDRMRHAMLLVVDVTGHESETTALLAKVDANLLERGGQKQVQKIAGIDMIVYRLPKKAGANEGQTVTLFAAKNRLVVGDHLSEVADVAKRLTGGATGGTLASLAAFTQVMQQTATVAEATFAPDVRWFVEPFGYTYVMRAARGGRRRRGKDNLATFAQQGFDAVRGVGGSVDFTTGEKEIVHSTFIYAPGAGGNRSRFELASRMLQFPNTPELVAYPWVPNDLATHLTFNFKMRDAFEYSETLVDALAGDKGGFFDEVWEGYKNDPNGPQFDVRKELVDLLGERVTVIADVVQPITPRSERLLIGLELTDAESVERSINRTLQNDPTFRRVDVNGKAVWESVPDTEEFGDEISIDDGVSPKRAGGGHDGPLFNTWALTIAHGQLLISTNIDFLKKVIDLPPEGARLISADDYQRVQNLLTDWSEAGSSFRYFSRQHEAYRATYELLRQQMMPQSESLLGKLLNRWWGPAKGKETREQQIDAHQLPDYEVAKRYLSPAGFTVTSTDMGWMIRGMVLGDPAEAPVTESREDVSLIRQ